MTRAAALAIALLLALSPAARANGDPASDILLQQDYFLPYAPPTQKRLEDALEKVLDRAEAAGWRMKVALIQTPSDLGAYQQLFNKPQEYADLLTRELGSINPHGRLERPRVLVVMPGGYGGNDLGERVDEALDKVAIQDEAQSDGLAKAAIEAVARLGQVNGFDVPIPPEARLKLSASDGSGGEGGTSPLVFIGPAVILFAALWVIGRLTGRRERAAQTPGPPDD